MRFIKFQAQVEPYGTHYARAKTGNSAQGLVFRCRSYHRTNFGTLCVLVFISVSTFAQAQVERCGTRRWLVPIQETWHNVCAVLYAGIAVIAFCKGYRSSWYSPLARAPSQTSARLACSLLFKRFFEIFFNPLVKIKLLSYNTYATKKNNSTKRISRQVGIR